MDINALGRLSMNVAARTEPVPPSCCVVWTGPVNNSGYGSAQIGGRVQLIHRAVYEWFVGPIPPGLTIDHLCRVRTCVNPAHMEAVTLRENNLRGNSVCAVMARRTVCERCGGPFTRSKNAPARHCRPCKNGYHVEYMATYRVGKERALRDYMKAYRLANPEKWALYRERQRQKTLAAKSAAESET